MALIDHLVLVPLDEEWQAVSTILCDGASPYEEPKDGVTYYSWLHSVSIKPNRSKPAMPGHYLTAAAVVGKAGQTYATDIASRAVSEWMPARVIVLGIAGGIDPKWIQLGDVVVPDLIFGYEVETVDGNPPEHRYRPVGYQAGAALIDQVRAFKNDGANYRAWQDQCIAAASPLIRSTVQARPPEFHVVPMASGNQVVRSAEQGRRLRAAISPLIGAVEMEGGGVFHAAWRGVQRPDTLMVRGISDLADENKTQLEESTHDAWRAFAAGNAARFVRSLWDRRTFPIAVPPVSPPLDINVNLAPRPREYFLQKDPITQTSEITIDYRVKGSQTLAFVDLIRRRGSTPPARVVVTAQIGNGTPAPDFRMQVVNEIADNRSVSKAIVGTNGRAEFPIEQTSEDLRIHLMVASPTELKSIQFHFEDDFERTAKAEWS